MAWKNNKSVYLENPQGSIYGLICYMGNKVGWQWSLHARSPQYKVIGLISEGHVFGYNKAKKDCNDAYRRHFTRRKLSCKNLFSAAS